jgi:predicted Fe-S protein YdhL (DUF1289 family)
MPDAAPTSPCIGICALDRLIGLCVGCWRSRAEVTAWRDLDEAGRATVIAQLAPRRAKHAPAAAKTTPRTTTG